MLRQTLLFLALAGAPALAAQQPTQQPTSAVKADTSKAKAKHHRAKKGKAGKSATAPKDTTKAKP
jgi:hypothetical protein